MLQHATIWRTVSGLGLLAALAVAPLARAQDRDDRYRDHDWDRDRRVYTRLVPGTVIPVRMSESIDADRGDNRVYYGVVNQDVMGENGRVAIPRGSVAELIVRVAPDNDLNLDLESLTVYGNRYGVRVAPNHIESQKPGGWVGVINGAVNGGTVRGRNVRIPRDSVVTFRLQQPLELGVHDSGVDRDGIHYHGGGRDH